MPTVTPIRETNAPESLVPPWTAPWFAMWKCATLWGQANLQALASVWSPRSPRGNSLAGLGQEMEREMRTPAFLALVPYRPAAFATRLGFELVRSLMHLYSANLFDAVSGRSSSHD